LTLVAYKVPAQKISPVDVYPMAGAAKDKSKFIIPDEAKPIPVHVAPAFVVRQRIGCPALVNVL
jgi:hypothetical protein